MVPIKKINPPLLMGGCINIFGLISVDGGVGFVAYALLDSRRSADPGSTGGEIIGANTGHAPSLRLFVLDRSVFNLDNEFKYTMTL